MSKGRAEINLRAFLRLLFTAIVFAVSSLAISACPATGQSVAETRIAALEPCGGLKQKAAGISFAIDKLEYVKLSRADLKLAGDEVTLSFEGGLGCRTSDSAVIKGNASVDVTGRAVLLLDSCTISLLSILPTQFGGTFGSILEAAWEPLVSPKIEAEAKSMLSAACKDFVTGL